MAKAQGILDALEDYYQGFSSIPSSVLQYVGSTDADKAAKDAINFAKESGSALIQQAKDDPINLLLDIAPIIGEVRAAIDAEELREAADAAEKRGDTEQAESLRQQASITMAGAIPLLGMASRLGGKLSKASMQMTNDGRPILRSDMVGEENIAVPDQDMMLAKRLIDTGFLTMQSAGKPASVKTALKKYREAMRGSKAFQDREMRAAENDYQTIFTPTDIGERTIINPETLLGKVIIPIQGDLSNLGILDRIGGIDVDTPVQAGNKYSQQYADSGFGWQSMLDTAQGVQNKIRQVESQTGQAPIGVYTTMGLDATNFSTPIAEAMLKQIQGSKITKADKEAFDRKLRSTTIKDAKGRVKKVFPDWVGLDHPDAMDQLMGQGKYENIGKKRTAFTTAMKTNDFRDRGFPNYNELLFATQDPDLINAPMKGSGLSMYQTLLGDAVYDPTVHKSYTGRMPGQYIGGLGGSIPFEVMFPDTFAEQMKRTTSAGTPFTPSQAIDAVMKKPEGFQIVDERTLQGIIDYIGREGLK